MQELNCEIIFSSKSVIFQEWKMKNVIGEGFLKNGRYYINEEKCNFLATREEELSTLWHRRTGHPSDKILKYIFDFKNIDVKDVKYAI
jgi:hypothetical protein